MGVRPVVLWGDLRDAPLAAVASILASRRVPTLLLHDDQTTAAENAQPEQPPEVSCGGRAVAIEDARSIYFRPYTTERADGLVRWLDRAPTLVVNRPAAGASNNSKPYQSQLLRRAGFDVPDTLITTSAAEAISFAGRHPAVVYKSISGMRSIVARLMDDDDRLGMPFAFPTQFQEWIPGPDVRLHVVGEESFACTIDSPADDYRYASRLGLAVRLSAVKVPHLAERAVALVRRLGLVVAGLDFRRRADGAWVCFEVNPSPAFCMFDVAANGRIAEAVSSLLAAGAVSHITEGKKAGWTATSSV